MYIDFTATIALHNCIIAQHNFGTIALIALNIWNTNKPCHFSCWTQQQNEDSGLIHPSINTSANLSVSIQSWLSTSFGHWSKFGVQMRCVWILNALQSSPSSFSWRANTCFLRPRRARMEIGPKSMMPLMVGYKMFGWMRASWWLDQQWSRLWVVDFERLIGGKGWVGHF